MEERQAQAEKILIKNVISKKFGTRNSKKYIEGISIAYSHVSDIYELAAKSLTEKKIEAAIRFMIFGLDINREFKPLLHLCKTMLTGFSQKLYESNYESIRIKYNSLVEYEKITKEKLRKITDQNDDYQEKINELEEFIEKRKPSFFSLKNFALIYYLTKSKKKNEISRIIRLQNSLEEEIFVVEKELKHIKKLVILQEYQNISRTIIEVCLFPMKYSWTLNNNEE